MSDKERKMAEREHVESADCWCNPRVEYIPPRGPDPAAASVASLDEYRGREKPWINARHKVV